MTSILPKPVVDFVLAQARGDLYGAYCRNRLLELLDIDTSPADLTNLPTNQAATLGLIAREMQRSLGDAARVERQPDNDAAGAAGNAPAAWHDLTVWTEGTGSRKDNGIFYTVGLETLGPYVPPRSTADRVFGCGAAGNKAHIVLLLAQNKLLADVRAQFALAPRVPIAYHFGTATHGRDAERPAMPERLLPAGWNAVVLAPTGGTPFTSQVGCVRFRLIFAGPHAVELFPFVVLALEKEGNRLREEVGIGPSDPRRALMQTNCGTFGPYGTHPALACEHLAIRIRIAARGNPDRIAMRMTEILDAVISEHVRHRVDLTKAIDPATGEAKLGRHYTLQLEAVPDAVQYRIDIHGRRAYPPAVAEADNAITKAAFLFDTLLRVRRNFPDARAEAVLADEASGAVDLEMTGAQSFLAPLDSTCIRKRLATAAETSLADYHRATGRTMPDDAVRITFDESEREPLVQATPPAVLAAFQSAAAAACVPLPTGGTWPLLSRADRLAEAGHPVVIFGPGRIDRTDTANECIEVREIQQALALSTLAALAHGATQGSGESSRAI